MAAGALVLATGCSGGDASGADQPVPSSPLTLGAESDTPTADPAADEAALRKLVKTYERVDAKADQAGNTDPSVYDGILSPEFADLLVDNMKKFILADGLHVLGQYRYRVEDVELHGDEATIEVCADGNGFFVVPAKQKTLSDADSGQPSILSTFTARRADDAWVLTGSDPKDAPC